MLGLCVGTVGVCTVVVRLDCVVCVWTVGVCTVVVCWDCVVCVLTVGVCTVVVCWIVLCVLGLHAVIVCL